MEAKTFFITGVPGSGKSAIIEPLKGLLGFAHTIHDFDERGVPDNVDTAWQASETKHWISVGASNAEKGITTIICGFAVPSEAFDRKAVKLILLDVSEKELQNRLMKRYSKPENVEELQRTRGITVDESVQENINSISWLRKLCNNFGAKIIDTSKLTPQQVAEAIANHIEQKVNSQYG